MMKRLALLLALLVAAPMASADEPPPWMPATPPATTSRSQREARALRHEAGVFAGIGIGLFAAGVAVNVVALDFGQGQRQVHEGDGTVDNQRYLNDANWAELAGGLALMVTGLALVAIGGLKLKRAHRLESE